MKIGDVVWVLKCEDEDLPVRGNVMASGNSELDKSVEDKILEELEYNEWAWCCVKLTGHYKGLEASEYLGGCSYKSREDFIKNSGYYDDMQCSILDDLEEQVEALQLPDKYNEALTIIKDLVNCPDYKNISTHAMIKAKEFIGANND